MKVLIPLAAASLLFAGSALAADPNLGRNPRHRYAWLRRQLHRLALELIREPTLRRTRHHTPPGSAEPIIGVRQTEG